MCVMMTEIKAIDGGQKRCFPWEGQTLRKKSSRKNNIGYTQTKVNISIYFESTSLMLIFRITIFIFIFLVSALLRDYSLCWDHVNDT